MMNFIFRKTAGLIFGLLLSLTAIPVVLAAHGSHQKPDIKVITPGSGAGVTSHSRVAVHYTGWLMDGSKFDSSLDRGKPFEFTLGLGQVIAGWDMGVAGMKVGEKRILVIPPELGYGKRGAGKAIPPNATLKFEISLISFRPPKYSNVGNQELQALLDKGVKIIDLRRPDEWKQTGTIKGSQRLTAFDGRGNFIRSFPAAFEKAAKPDEEVILICHTGSRSAAVANMLVEQAGYKSVYNVVEGIEKWIKDGHPIVR